MEPRAEKAELSAANLLEPKGDRDQGSRYAEEYLNSMFNN